MTYIEEIRALVGTRPLILVGAVVIISDDEGRVLLEQRKFPYGQWGLPGGLMELGESAEDAARREVLEETSLVVGSLVLEGVYSGPDHFITAVIPSAIVSIWSANTSVTRSTYPLGQRISTASTRLDVPSPNSTGRLLITPNPLPPLTSA